MRLLAILEGLGLLGAAAVYGAVAVLWGFLALLGAFHWQTFSLLVISAVACVACLVIAMNLFSRPTPQMMAIGGVLIVVASILALQRW